MPIVLCTVLLPSARSPALLCLLYPGPHIPVGVAFTFFDFFTLSLSACCDPHWIHATSTSSASCARVFESRALTGERWTVYPFQLFRRFESAFPR